MNPIAQRGDAVRVGDALRYSADPGHENSVAALLDRTREALADAQDRGERIDRLLVDGALYQVLVDATMPEHRTGDLPTVLGLYVEPLAG